MRFTAFALAVLALAVACNAHLPKHKCIHSEIQAEIYTRPFNDQDGGDRRNRVLQQEPQPIRINFDVSQLSDLPTEQLDFIIKNLYFAKDYFSRVLKVKQPLPDGAGIFDGQTDCADMIYFSAEDIPPVFENTDLMIFAAYVDEPDEGYLAYAAACTLTGIDNRPILGGITFNSAYLPIGDGFVNSDYIDFLATVIHEITHILGFDIDLTQYYQNPDPNSPDQGDDYTQSIIQYIDDYTIAFSGPNVLQLGRDYFACPDLIGVRLEDEGDSGSAYSHWERVTLYSEYMTASGGGQRMTYTAFTLSLLKDSGWYEPDFSYADPLYWGRGKGCDFALNGCNAANCEPEFVLDGSDHACTFDYDAAGDVWYEYFSNECEYSNGWGATICYNDITTNSAYSNHIFAMGSNFAADSHCFTSDFTNTASTVVDDTNMRCFQSTCDATTVDGVTTYNGIFVNIKRPAQRDLLGAAVAYTDGGLTTGADIVQFECTTEGATVTLDITFTCPADNAPAAACTEAHYVGTVTCPDNFPAFCDRLNVCENLCSQKGYCTRGACTCLPGTSGTDCSVGDIDYTFVNEFFNLTKWREDNLPDDGGDQTDDGESENLKEVSGSILKAHSTTLIATVLVIISVILY